MSATTLTAAASAIATRLATISGVKIYDHEPLALDVLPAVTVEGPTVFTRTGTDQPESQLGANDWHTTWTVRIYVARDVAQTAEVDTRTLLAQVVDAFDAGQTLGGVALDTKLTGANREPQHADHTRAMLITACQIDAWLLV